MGSPHPPAAGAPGYGPVYDSIGSKQQIPLKNINAYVLGLLYSPLEKKLPITMLAIPNSHNQLENVCTLVFQITTFLQYWSHYTP